MVTLFLRYFSHISRFIHMTVGLFHLLIAVDRCMSGTLGVKFDHLGLTKSVEDLPLNELLDGSFSCPPNSYQERAKKASSANENILLSIRKAASVLTAPNAMGSSGSWKAPGTVDSTNCEKEEKYAESSAFFPPVSPKISLLFSKKKQKIFFR